MKEWNKPAIEEVELKETANPHKGTGHESNAWNECPTCGTTYHVKDGHNCIAE